MHVFRPPFLPLGLENESRELILPSKMDYISHKKTQINRRVCFIGLRKKSTVIPIYKSFEPTHHDVLGVWKFISCNLLVTFHHLLLHQKHGLKHFKKHLSIIIVSPSGLRHYTAPIPVGYTSKLATFVVLFNRDFLPSKSIQKSESMNKNQENLWGRQI